MCVCVYVGVWACIIFRVFHLKDYIIWNREFYFFFLSLDDFYFFLLPLLSLGKKNKLKYFVVLIEVTNMNIQYCSWLKENKFSLSLLSIMLSIFF